MQAEGGGGGGGLALLLPGRAPGDGEGRGGGGGGCGGGKSWTKPRGTIEVVHSQGAEDLSHKEIHSSDQFAKHLQQIIKQLTKGQLGLVYG